MLVKILNIFGCLHYRYAFFLINKDLLLKPNALYKHFKNSNQTYN